MLLHIFEGGAVGGDDGVRFVGGGQIGGALGEGEDAFGETDEFEAVSAPGAINVPLSLIQKHGKKAFTKAGVDPETDGLLVICRSGGRSAMACQLIGAQAINVEGGMLAWVTAGLPTS